VEGTEDVLAGRRILITGAARGIGEATARRLHASGARLALLDLERDRLERVARELDSVSLACDVASERETRAAVDSAASQLGGIDAVVANAGISVVATTDTIAPADFRRMIEVNLIGVWYTLRSAIPYVTDSGGYLLSISSLAATMHLPTLGGYSAAKAGVHALADVMRLELRGCGVAVGCGYFGLVETDLSREARAHRAGIADRGGAQSTIARPISVEQAARGVVDAIERRARWIVRPRHLFPLIALPSGFQLLLESFRPHAREQQIACTRAAPGSVRPGLGQPLVPDREHRGA
jgi:NAD(P)-dependent dehydrogenase (short-subunit alcohol dehydrogenase family)